VTDLANEIVRKPHHMQYMYLSVICVVVLFEVCRLIKLIST